MLSREKTLEVYVFLVIGPVPTRSKTLLTIPTLVRFDLVMNGGAVALQLATRTEPFVTNLTGEGSQIEVHRVHVPLEFVLRDLPTTDWTDLYEF